MLDFTVFTNKYFLLHYKHFYDIQDLRTQTCKYIHTFHYYLVLYFDHIFLLFKLYTVKCVFKLCSIAGCARTVTHLKHGPSLRQYLPLHMTNENVCFDLYLTKIWRSVLWLFVVLQFGSTRTTHNISPHNMSGYNHSLSTFCLHFLSVIVIASSVESNKM
jgi:hypothetical protein